MSKLAGSLKTGGRKKGTPNKKTLGLEDALEAHGLNIIAELSTLMPQLPADKKADVLLNLMGYLFPKRKAVELVSASEVTVISPPVPELTDEEAEEKLRKLVKTLQILDETHVECYHRMKAEDEAAKAKRAESVT